MKNWPRKLRAIIKTLRAIMAIIQKINSKEQKRIAFWFADD